MKYINVDEFIEKHGNCGLNNLNLLEKLKEESSADVIPVSFIDEWYKKQYGLQFNPIVNDWRKYEASVICNTQKITKDVVKSI